MHPLYERFSTFLLWVKANHEQKSPAYSSGATVSQEHHSLRKSPLSNNPDTNANSAHPNLNITLPWAQNSGLILCTLLSIFLIMRLWIDQWRWLECPGLSAGDGRAFLCTPRPTLAYLVINVWFGGRHKASRKWAPHSRTHQIWPLKGI